MTLAIRKINKEDENISGNHDWTKLIGKREQKELMRLIQQQMLTKSNDFVGDLYDPEDLPNGCQHASVERLAKIKSGPEIFSPSVYDYDRPQLEKIKEKLTEKTYKTSAPLVLFAYSGNDGIDTYADGLAKMDEYMMDMKGHLENSRFQYVFVSDLRPHGLTVIYPRKSPTFPIHDLPSGLVKYLVKDGAILGGQPGFAADGGQQ